MNEKEYPNIFHNINKKQVFRCMTFYDLQQEQEYKHKKTNNFTNLLRKISLKK